MNTFRTFRSLRNSFLSMRVLAASVWILGLFSGAYILDHISFSMMRPIIVERVSIVCLLFSLSFPFVLSFILLRYFHFWSILPLIFIKAVSFMCCLGGISLAFGDAGWLIRGLVLFADSIGVVFLIFSWYEALDGKRYRWKRFAGTYLPVLGIIGFVDYFVLSEYVVILLNH